MIDARSARVVGVLAMGTGFHWQRVGELLTGAGFSDWWWSAQQLATEKERLDAEERQTEQELFQQQQQMMLLTQQMNERFSRLARLREQRKQIDVRGEQMLRRGARSLDELDEAERAESEAIIDVQAAGAVDVIDWIAVFGDAFPDPSEVAVNPSSSWISDSGCRVSSLPVTWEETYVVSSLVLSSVGFG